mgnify:CR=1 FL=1
MYKEAIIFAVGLGLGAFIGYKYAEKKLTELNEKDIAELKAYYNGEFQAKLFENKEKMAENDEKLPENDLQNSIDNSSNGYEKAIKAMNEPIVEEKSAEINEKRVIISSDEFLDDEEYDKETIYYYEEDEVFCDPEYEILPEAIDRIGKENLDNVGMFENNVLYVRNELFGKDYEVIFYEGAYSDIIEDSINEE